MNLSTDPTEPPKSWGARIGLPAALAFGAVIFGMAVLAQVSGDDEDDSDDGVKMTLTQAACRMLAEGDDPEDVYATAKILAAQHPLVYGEDESIAARAAVNAAQGQGCG